MLLLWVPPLLGWGSLSSRYAKRWGLILADSLSLGLLGLLGILVVGVAASAANLLVGLRTWFPLFVLGGGWIALGVFYASVKPKISYLTAIVSTVVAALISVSTLFADFVYDAGLYHLPAIRWSLDSAIPFGLANLNSYTGYNSMWFLFSSALTLPGLEQKGIAIAESLACFFFVLFLLEPLFNSRGTKALALSLLTLSVFCLSGLEAGVGSNSTDLPLIVYLIGCTLLFVEKEYFLSALFGAFGFAIKLSGAPVALLFIASALFLLPRQKRFVAGALIGGILCLCIGRGILLSGCALYPETRSCVSGLPWTVKPALVTERNYDVRNSAGSCLVRSKDQILSCYTHELGPSLIKLRIVQLLLLSLMVALVFWAIRSWGSSRMGLSMSGLKVAIVFHSIGLCFWFFAAPDPRFGAAYFVALSALPLAGAFKDLRPNRAALFSSWVLVLALGGLWGKRLLVLSEAGPARPNWPRVAEVKVVETKLATGQAVYQPAEHYSCGLSELPCRVPASYPLAMETKWGRPLFYSP